MAVTVVKNPNSNEVVTAYTGNPEYGFIILESEELVMNGLFVNERKRSTVLRGKVELLEKHYHAGKQLTGKISVVECTEDNIPAICQSQLQKDLPYEEQIEKFIKRAGSPTAPILMADDKRILRFTTYDASGLSADIRVPHTNTDEVRAYNQAHVTKVATKQ